MSNRYAQIVMGPAGSGKTTYIKRLMDHFEVTKRNVHAVNLDPAADNLAYTPTIDIRDAINVKEVMEEEGFGPNGGLIYCMEVIVEDHDWFDEEIGNHDYDYLLIDLPGQIELFSHLNILPQLFKNLEDKGYHLCGVFLLDSQFMIDPSKFLSGSLVAISVMTMLEIPHVNLLSKCDLLTEEQMNRIDEFCDMDTGTLCGSITAKPQIQKLTEKICELIDEYSLLQFIPYNPFDNDMLIEIVAQIDLILQYYDNADLSDNDDENDHPEVEDVQQEDFI
ncbi:GPN-loop GTPase 3 [Histomonas meleagridis]|uniref:GPN-loop GTPase 3 n=1 Tax=Histomonas meleagridis TaxID=135588 RepID=UPI003559BEC4|nr:GPN-loop GTPase 3 [Histomonas meleagridis]KAH0796148.1 GPN-loop GTPase 3 [Histomonas meleagridis]